MFFPYFFRIVPGRDPEEPPAPREDGGEEKLLGIERKTEPPEIVPRPKEPREKELLPPEKNL
jgi:hypothetical protein